MNSKELFKQFKEKQKKELALFNKKREENKLKAIKIFIKKYEKLIDYELENDEEFELTYKLLEKNKEIFKGLYHKNTTTTQNSTNTSETNTNAV